MNNTTFNLANKSNVLAKRFVESHQANFSYYLKRAVVGGLVTAFFAAITALVIYVLMTNPSILHSPAMFKIGVVLVGGSIGLIGSTFLTIHGINKAATNATLKYKDHHCSIDEYKEYKDFIKKARQKASKYNERLINSGYQIPMPANYSLGQLDQRT